MIKTYLYLPEELNIKAKRIADAQNKSKASVLRTALEVGLNSTQYKEKDTSAQFMLDLIALGKKIKATGPKDLSSNIDKYLWDEYEL